MSTPTLLTGATCATVATLLIATTVLAVADDQAKARSPMEVKSGGQASSFTREPGPAKGPACALSADELQARRKELLPGLFDRADLVTELRNGVRLTFSHRPGLVSELAALIEAEQGCCSFLRFRLTTSEGAGPVSLEVRGPRGTAALLRKLQAS